jgi:type IX secretion system PorP/SprF family membrane protein
MKKFVFLCSMFLALGSAFGQQVEEFSLLRENAFTLNPAMAGTNGFVHGFATFRKQFTRIEQSPYTAVVSADVLIKEKNLGVGGYIVHDVTGPTGKTSGTVSVAYHIPLTRKNGTQYTNGKANHLLSIGASLSIVQYRLQADKLLLDNPGDPELYTSRGTRIFPDASFGVYYRFKDMFYAGVSAPQLLGLNINYRGTDGFAKIKTVQHLNILLGGRYEWARGNFSIDPVASLRWVKGGPPQGDVGLRFNMYKIFFVGANYRSLNYAVFEGGFNVKDVFFFAYACDLNCSKYRQDLGTTHEITLSFKVPRTDRVWRGVGPALRF